MELDLNYGLKSAHHIDSFGEFFAQTGLAEKLLNPAPSVTDGAIGELTEYWLNDLHSAYIARSYLSEGCKTNAWDPGYSTVSDSAKGQQLAKIRDKYPE